MKLEEFLEDKPEEEIQPQDLEELDVQKAVVESLAADNAEQQETISKLRKENNEIKSQLSDLRHQIEEMKAALEKVGDVLADNSADSTGSSKVAILERDPEVKDRFPGETREHILEIITDAREAAERDGRIRRAQLLEAVLVANEKTGALEKKRTALKKFFDDNANIISGPVIEELKRCGIAYKNGEEYLLTSEILKRTY